MSPTFDTPDLSSGFSYSKSKKKGNWRTLIINANGVLSKTAEIAAIIDYCDPDLMLFTETKIDSSISFSEFLPNGYNGGFRRDRNKNGGGVMIVTKQEYTITDLDLLTPSQHNSESVWASISLKDHSKLIVGSFYRLPDKGIEPILNLETELSEITEKLRNNSKYTVMLGGDFNAANIDWDTGIVPDSTDNRLMKEKLVTVLAEAGLTQMQRDPTRGQNLLDLFCCNKPSLVKSCISIPGISDHSIVLADCNLKTPITNKPQRRVYRWSKADWHKIKGLTTTFAESFLALANSRSVNDHYLVFKKFMEGLLKTDIPSKLTGSRHNLPWINTELKRQIRKKGRRFSKAKKSGLKEDWDNYKAIEKDVKCNLNRAETNFLQTILTTGLESGDTKPFWKYVRSQKQEHFGITALRSNGSLYTDSSSKSEILNKQFKSVFTPPSLDETPKVPGQPFPPIKDLRITEHGVYKLIDGINTSKSSGPDGIPGKLLQSLAKELAPVLRFIFEQSLLTVDLPIDWTRANVAPVFKKGSKLQAVNYRPVSLTCITCKLFEHIICRHVLDHLEQHKILTDLQHGFRSGRSCETQLITTFQDIAEMYDKKGSQIDIAVLDFSKAFDTVPHDGLLSKLKHYGIDKHIWQWISNFLKKRKQCVVVDGVSSGLVDVDSEVPQGTVLGPILFLLHINDLPSIVSSKVRLFADDCLIYRQIKSNNDQIELQRDLNLLESWGVKWGMRFNAAKCNIMRVSRIRLPFLYSYKLSGQVLDEVKDSKYLGVTISDNLDWSKHITTTTTKANARLSFIKRNLKDCPQKLKEIAYFSLVRSFVDYASAVWDPHQKYNQEKLEMVQRRAARFVKSRYKRTDSVTAMLDELGWPILSKRRKDARLILFYKIINNLAQVPHEHILIKAYEGTRKKNNHKFRHIAVNTSQYRQSFSPKTVGPWNQLSFADSPTLENFRINLMSTNRP